MKTIQLLLILAAITTIFSNKMKRLNEEVEIEKAFATTSPKCVDVNKLLTNEFFKRNFGQNIVCEIDCESIQKVPKIWNDIVEKFNQIFVISSDTTENKTKENFKKFFDSEKLHLRSNTEGCITLFAIIKNIESTPATSPKNISFNTKTEIIPVTKQRKK